MVAVARGLVDLRDEKGLMDGRTLINVLTSVVFRMRDIRDAVRERY